MVKTNHRTNAVKEKLTGGVKGMNEELYLVSDFLTSSFHRNPPTSMPAVTLTLLRKDMTNSPLDNIPMKHNLFALPVIIGKKYRKNYVGILKISWGVGYEIDLLYKQR